MVFNLTPKQKLTATIGISFIFFVAEIVVAFWTKSLALLADAFHYMNDLIGFIVALTAIIISERAESPGDFSFGWARASLLGAFFNGVFLLALGVSIFLQSVERFLSVQRVENPKLVLIMGCIGLTLNILSATLLHEHHGHDHGGHGHSHSHSHAEGDDPTHSHSHGEEGKHHSHRDGPVNIETGLTGGDGVHEHPMSTVGVHSEHRHNATDRKPPGRDLGILGVLIHVIGDALNNIGVIISALVIWLTSYDARFYADPGTSMGIAIMILLTSLPLVKQSGKILMQSAPHGVVVSDVKHDLEKIPGIESVHELHIWRLDQKKAIASAHVVVSDDRMTEFMNSAKTVAECLHAYGIHSATLQPELPPSDASTIVASSASNTPSVASSVRRRRANGGDGPAASCQMACGNLCQNLMCCTTITTRPL